MKPLIVDASAFVEFLLRTPSSEELVPIMTDPDVDLHTPALCDVEVTAALRRSVLLGLIEEDRAVDALDDYLDLPLRRHGHEPLVGRALALRDNFSAYDATYIALAEIIGGTLLTADCALSRAVRVHLGVDTLPA